MMATQVSTQNYITNHAFLIRDGKHYNNTTRQNVHHHSLFV